MGSTTTFKGTFQLNRPLTEAQRAYLDAFNEIGHYVHDEADIPEIDDPIREAVGLPPGPGGAYVVGQEGNFRRGQPKGQPGNYCQWVPTKDGAGIEWDGGEKFYDWPEWLTYIVDHFLKPWDLTLNGRVAYHGEDVGDAGYLVCKDNVVTKHPLGSEGTPGGPSLEERDAVARCDNPALADLFLPEDATPAMRAKFLTLAVAAREAALEFVYRFREGYDASEGESVDLTLEMLAPLRRFRGTGSESNELQSEVPGEVRSRQAFDGGAEGVSLRLQRGCPLRPQRVKDRRD